ncbi:MAG TPA: ATP-binding protein [Gemmatimonadales bacterium]|nr:ATP-binding protein [Gemmatimonadales bacterium]
MLPSLGWLEQLSYSPGDAEETRHRKVQFTIASILMIPAGLVWGALYFAYGARTVAAIPVAYSVVTLLDLLILSRLRRYQTFRQTQQLLILVLPFALQVALGGFVGSGLVILWSFIAVLMAVLFGGVRSTVWWFIAYVTAIVAAALLQPQLAIDNPLPAWLILTFFVLNVVAVSSLAFIVLRSFVTDRRRLRELEVAYLNQEMMLRQSEKLATLGTLAAGVAHELNNPAAATRRAAEQLGDAFARLEAAHLRLSAMTLTSSGRDLLQSLERQGRERAVRPNGLDVLARSDEEAVVEAWLEERSIADPWQLAPSLVGQGLDRPALARLAGALQGEALGAALAWAASVFSVHTLLYEIGQGSTRVAEVVGALKSYSYLGEAPVQSVDLKEGLDNTLVILRNKLKAGITVHRDYGADVPPVQAYGSELNQVWTNLLDNAADAMGGQGEITIRTRRRDAWAVVEIEDNGPGIPVEIQPRIFDPFFTTKAPGKGTGLGLSTSYTIVTRKHAGEIRVTSRPGFTCFTVKLPIQGPSTEEQHG